MFYANKCLAKVKPPEMCLYTLERAMLALVISVYDESTSTGDPLQVYVP